MSIYVKLLAILAVLLIAFGADVVLHLNLLWMAQFDRGYIAGSISLVAGQAVFAIWRS